MSNKQKKVLFWVIVGLGLILVGFSIYRINRLGEEKGNGINMIGKITNEERAQNEEGREEDKEEFEVLEEDDREEIDISDWMTYRNEEYGFEMRYPEGWCVDCKGKQSVNIEFIRYDELPEFTNFQAPVPIKTKDEFIKSYIDSQESKYYKDIGGLAILQSYDVGTPPGADFSRHAVFFPSSKQRVNIYTYFLVGNKSYYIWREDKETIIQIIDDLKNGIIYPQEIQTFDQIISTLRKIE